MSCKRILAAVGIAAALSPLLPAPADAQSRGRAQRRGPVVVGRAVPRRGPVPRTIRPQIVTVVPYRPYYYPGFSLGLGFGYGGFGYGGFGYGAPVFPTYRSYYGRSYRYAPGFPYSYGNGPYGYGYEGGYRYAPGNAYGGVRIDLPQRDAQVFVDGYYAGIVNDFDGALQHLDLTPGPHRIEVRAEGYVPITFEVNVEPGRTITYRADMQPAP